MVSLGIHGAQGMNPIRYIYVPQMTSVITGKALITFSLWFFVHIVKIKYFPSSLLSLDSNKDIYSKINTITAE